jgi:hypothetical protein
MMVGNNRGIKSYYCKQSFHTARREDLTDQVVVDIILARLNKPDVLDLLTDNNTDTTVREAEQKRPRLDTFIDAAADGSITATALARIETKLLTEIDAAHTRARRARGTLPSDTRTTSSKPITAGSRRGYDRCVD